MDLIIFWLHWIRWMAIGFFAGNATLFCAAWLTQAIFWSWSCSRLSGAGSPSRWAPTWRCFSSPSSHPSP